MTPGMFLIASILRMATVVGAPERVVDEPIHDNLLSEQWTAHRLEVEGERVMASSIATFPTAIRWRSASPTIAVYARRLWRRSRTPAGKCWRFRK